MHKRHQIELDLISAADNLSYVPSQEGRVTKGAAQALLGKVYLYQDKFTESADVLEKLMLNFSIGLLEEWV